MFFSVNLNLTQTLRKQLQMSFVFLVLFCFLFYNVFFPHLLISLRIKTTLNVMAFLQETRGKQAWVWAELYLGVEYSHIRVLSD